MTMKVVSNCSQKGGKKRQQSTWGLWIGRSQVVISTRNARQGPQISKSQRLRRSLTIVAKRKEKENNSQYEDCDQEGHE
jgi:hypothetical protein